MGAEIADLRDAIVDYINGQSYSQSFTATGANVPVLEVESTSSPVVTVFPGEYTVQEETRGDWRYEWTMHVAVQKVVDGVTEEDAMLLLAEEIEQSLQDQEMDSKSLLGISYTSGARAPFAAEQLVSSGVFTTVLEATYVASF